MVSGGEIRRGTPNVESHKENQTEMEDDLSSFKTLQRRKTDMGENTFFVYTCLSALMSIGLAFIPAYIAGRKGRSFGLWWVYGYFLFIIALIHSLAIKNESYEGSQEGNAVTARSVPVGAMAPLLPAYWL